MGDISKGVDNTLYSPPKNMQKVLNERALFLYFQTNGSATDLESNVNEHILFYRTSRCKKFYKIENLS
jgi:hypothetical protein